MKYRTLNILRVSARYVHSVLRQYLRICDNHMKIRRMVIGNISYTVLLQRIHAKMRRDIYRCS